MLNFHKEFLKFLVVLESKSSGKFNFESYDVTNITFYIDTVPEEENIKRQNAI